MSQATVYTLFPSPLGPLLLISIDDRLSGLWTNLHTRGPRVQADWHLDEQPTHGVLAETGRQLTAYFAGRLNDFDLPLDMRGTEFQRRVWEELTRISNGTTTSYGELAARIGKPTASRAVGAANGRNPVSIIVPCHRVIGSTGSLTGYGGGLENKRWLLDFENRHYGFGSGKGFASGKAAAPDLFSAFESESSIDSRSPTMLASSGKS